MAFFNVGALGGNPFSTQVGQRIEQATDSSLASENWALNMEICDMINESSDAARDAMKAIRKRLQQNAGKNYTVIMYTLTVLETCVKNCGKAFHVLVANKEFIQELVKLIGPKNDPPAVVQEKVLNLIQIWAETFRTQPDLNGVVQVYQELKNKGIEFPMTDMDAMAPIYTPQRSVPDGVSQAATVTNSPQHTTVTVPGPTSITGPMTLSPEQVAKLQSELDIVTVNMSILGEMLTELKPGQEDPSDHKLLTDLAHTCREMQGRIVELIGKVNHDEITAELLRINDELNNLFLRYSRFEKNRDTKAAATPSAILGAAMGVPPAATEEGATAAAKDSLIDLSDEAAGGLPQQFAAMGMGETTKVSQISSVSAQSGSVGQHRDVDEFDMLAQSRNVSDQAKGTPQKDTTTTKGPHDLNARESEFDEMAAWLENDQPTSDNKPRMTSKEFDRFLAERVAAAENLPSIPSQTGAVGSTAAATNGATASTAPTTRHNKSRKDEDGLIAL
ncbi:TOM1-like protein 2 isoform X2 [Lutzomyia longipalpis]|uniref:TOM1-like protein 2 isoform X2 n=1 Tax=Lutzomyia longipalpis TaxID=7200 RepID=UPI0024840A37|nr:TOM1-like protein 2 isoform X2 [Lutzomyia longipalpis]